MQLQDQVISLELAKQLKEEGVPQNSLFYWVEFFGERYQIEAVGFANPNQDGIWSAFTVAELGELLPKYLGDNKWEHLQQRWDSEGITEVGYYGGGFGFVEKTRNEAEARCRTLLFLISLKLVSF